MTGNGPSPISTHSVPQVSPGNAVSARGVRQEFDGNVVALDGINLDVRHGEFLAILGPSGCGKSTLLRIIAGLDRPTAGTICVNLTAAEGCGDREAPGPSRQGRVGAHSADGKDPHLGPLPKDQERGKRHQSPRADVAYVFQDAHLLPWRSVLRNVALPLELMGVPKTSRLARSLRAIEHVGLGDAADRYPNQLSGGMRMRVSLARAMVTDPKLLLLDEPFAALDEITRQQLDEELRRLWAMRGMTVIFVTHSTAEAAFLAGRAIVMSPRPGRIVLDRKIDLPDTRDGLIRATPAFAQEIRSLYEALEQGTNRS